MNNRLHERGIGLVELIIVAVLALIIVAMAAPSFISTQRNYRSLGDAREVAAEILLAKMRAAAAFTQTRTYFDASAQQFRLETWDKANSCWKTSGQPDCTTQPSQRLSTGISFGFGSLTTDPLGNAITQAPPCVDDTGTTTKTVTGHTIANTACIVFNSRGMPVDINGSPSASAVYITDKSSVYAATISVTGQLRQWRSDAGTADWAIR